MTREIVFHLGDTKTGSTSIQRALAARGWEGGRRSIYYESRMNHRKLAHSLHRERDKADRALYWSRMAQALKAADADIGVVSAEGFEMVDPDAFADALETHFGAWRGKVRLISYVRPHADRLISSFAERTKQGEFAGTIEALHEEQLKRGRLMYTPRFAHWRRNFGPAFSLHPMIRDRLRDGDVVADFLDWLFPGERVTVKDQISANESLSMAELMALREVHRAIRRTGRAENRPNLPPDVHKTLGWEVALAVNALRPPGGIEKPRLHRALAERLVADYREDAAALDAMFFQGAPMTWALTAAPGEALAAPMSAEAEAYFSHDALRMIQAIGTVTGRAFQNAPDQALALMRRTGPARAARTGGRAGSKAGGKAGKGGAGKAVRAGGATAGPDEPKRGQTPDRGQRVPTPARTARDELPLMGPAAEFGRKILPKGLRRRLRPLARRILG